MSKKGGYTIVDFQDVALIDGAAAGVKVAGATEAIADAGKKATIVSGLVVGDVAYDDLYVNFSETDDGYVGVVWLSKDEGIEILVEEGDYVTATSFEASGGGAQYTLPAATASTLGGVKIGSGISVEEDGTISATQYTLPAATAGSLGGVKVGSGLSVTEDGTLSATGGGGGSEITIVPADGLIINGGQSDTQTISGLNAALSAAYTAGKPIFISQAIWTAGGSGATDVDASPIPVYITEAAPTGGAVTFVMCVYTGAGNAARTFSVDTDDVVRVLV